MESLAFSTVELLCMATEATLALILITIVGGRRASGSRSNEDAGPSVAWESQQELYLSSSIARGLLLHGLSDNLANQRCVAMLENQLTHYIPDPWRDRLTGLLNRAGCDKFLDRWQSSLNDSSGTGIQTVLSIDNYSALLESQGAMVVEQTVRKMSDELKSVMAPHGIVVRYQLDQFAILSFGSIQSAATSIALVAEQFTDPSVFTIEGANEPIQCSACTFALEPSSMANLIEKIESGLLQANTLVNPRTVAWIDDAWIHFKDASRLPKKFDVTTTSPNAPTRSTAFSGQQSAPNFVVGPSSRAPFSMEQRTPEGEPVASSESTSAEPLSVGDTASKDDIAALFAQMGGNKSGKPAEKPANKSSATTMDTATTTPKASTATPAPPEAPKADSNANASQPTGEVVSDAASADDIAALFASVKPNTAQPSISPASPVATTAIPSTTPSATTTTAPAGDAVVAQVSAPASPSVNTTSSAASSDNGNSNDAVSSDDIAALFQAVKAQPAAIKPLGEAIGATPQQGAVDASSTTPTLASPSGPATAVVAPQATMAAAPTAPTANTPAPVKAAEASGASDSVSVDDIAALFQSISPAAAPSTSKAIEAPQAQPAAPATKEPSVANPPPAKIQETVAEVNETATADDIAALFATVKSATKSNPDAPAIKTPTAEVIDEKVAVAATATVAPPAAAVPKEQELTAVASAEEIARLFSKLKAPPTPSHD